MAGSKGQGGATNPAQRKSNPAIACFYRLARRAVRGYKAALTVTDFRDCHTGRRTRTALPGRYDDAGGTGTHGRLVLAGDEPAIVDPGLSTGAEHVLTALEELEIDTPDVEHLLLTHIHLDHAGAAGYLAEECENADVVCHEVAADFLSDASRVETLIESVHRAVGELAERYGTARAIPRDRFVALSGGETVEIGDRTLDVVPAPGHAPHQVCFHEPDERLLFTADECGEYLDGRLLATTPPNFDLEENLDTLDRLKELDVETLLYPHFGPRVNAEGVFEEYRTVLSSWVKKVEEKWEEHGDREAVVRELVQSDHLHYEV